MSSYRVGSQSSGPFSRGISFPTPSVSDKGTVVVVASEEKPKTESIERESVDCSINSDIRHEDPLLKTIGLLGEECIVSVLPRVMNGIEVSLDSLGGEISRDTCVCIEDMSPRAGFSPKRQIPVNLTWIVIFAVTICSISLLFDELFFSHDYMWTPLSHGKDRSLETSSSSGNLLSFLSSGSAEHRAMVRGGAVFVFFVILAIWCVSAYIKIAYLNGHPVHSRKSPLKGADSKSNAQRPSWQLLGKRR